MTLDDMGGRGVQKGPILGDVIYEQPHRRDWHFKYFAFSAVCVKFCANISLNYIN